MGTGYYKEITATITGALDEDYENRSTQTEVFRLKLALLCEEYGLDLDFRAE